MANAHSLAHLPPRRFLRATSADTDPRYASAKPQPKERS